MKRVDPDQPDSKDGQIDNDHPFDYAEQSQSDSKSFLKFPINKNTDSRRNLSPRKSSPRTSIVPPSNLTK